MSNNTKIHLTIYLESGILVRQNEVEQIKYQLTERDFNPKKQWKHGEGFNIIEEGYISHKPLIAKGKTTQHLNLNEKCYDAFISINCPFWITKWEWKNMNKTQKLKANLQRICETLGGKSYDYQIIED